MSKATLFKKDEMTWESCAEPFSTVQFTRPIGDKLTNGMGAGIAIIENIAYDWTVTYNEVLYIIEGELRVTVDGEAFVCQQGDFLWLPKDTPMEYAADGRVVVLYALDKDAAVAWNLFSFD